MRSSGPCIHSLVAFAHSLKHWCCCFKLNLLIMIVDFSIAWFVLFIQLALAHCQKLIELRRSVPFQHRMSMRSVLFQPFLALLEQLSTSELPSSRGLTRAPCLNLNVWTRVRPESVSLPPLLAAVNCIAHIALSSLCLSALHLEMFWIHMGWLGFGLTLVWADLSLGWLEFGLTRVWAGSSLGWLGFGLTRVWADLA